MRLLLAMLLLAAPLRADPVARWIAAGELATMARAERDAILLAAAARQLALAEAEDASLARAIPNAAGLLEEARTLAGRDPVATAVINRYAGVVSRGSTAGTALETVTLDPGAEAKMIRTFRAGQSAIVYSEARGPFLLSVESGGPVPICRRAGDHGAALCRWMPAQAGPVTLRLANLGAEPQRLTLITN